MESRDCGVYDIDIPGPHGPGDVRVALNGNISIVVEGVARNLVRPLAAIPVVPAHEIDHGCFSPMNLHDRTLGILQGIRMIRISVLGIDTLGAVRPN